MIVSRVVQRAHARDTFAARLRGSAHPAPCRMLLRYVCVSNRECVWVTRVWLTGKRDEIGNRFDEETVFE